MSSHPSPFRKIALLLCILTSLAPITSMRVAAASPSRPNVLVILADDLNDWIGCMKGHPQAVTPNIDRLASRGVLFTNAHCQAPLCGPSRASFWYGRRPSTSGVYANFPKEYKKIPTLTGLKSMPEYFAANGYETLAIGKLFHNGYTPNPNQTEFQTAGPWDNDMFGPYPDKKIHQTDGLGSNNPAYDWGFPYESDEVTKDHQYTTWAMDQIAKPREKPFFMAVGLTKTHLPHFASKSYEDQFPLQTVKLPPILENDLDDVPAFGVELNKAHGMPSHAWVVKNNALPGMVQAYLACVASMDKQIGRLMEALEASGKADSTIVVLTSDHGFHRGEKQQYEKWTLWERSTRVPLIISDPGTTKGGICQEPVELLDIYPTLVDLCGLPSYPVLEGVSLLRQLEDPSSERTRPALTTWFPKNHSIQTRQWHYIRYADGTEELYDKAKDPNEWNNIAGSKFAHSIINDLARWLPTHNEPPVPGSDYIAVPQVVRDSGEWIKE
jgi:choline-sulfatase